MHLHGVYGNWSALIGNIRGPYFILGPNGPNGSIGSEYHRLCDDSAIYNLPSCATLDNSPSHNTPREGQLGYVMSIIYNGPGGYGLDKTWNRYTKAVITYKIAIIGQHEVFRALQSFECSVSVSYDPCCRITELGHSYRQLTYSV